MYDTWLRDLLTLRLEFRATSDQVAMETKVWSNDHQAERALISSREVGVGSECRPAAERDERAGTLKAVRSHVTRSGGEGGLRPKASAWLQNAGFISRQKQER